MSKISMELEKEKKLIKAAQKGGRKGSKAFEKIYAHYKPHLEHFFQARLGRCSTVDDLVAESFKKALNGLDSFQWQGVSLSAWLYKISRNVLTDYFRKEAKRKTTRLQDIAPPQSEEINPLEKTIRKEKYSVLHNILQELPKREEKIIYLKFFEGRRNKDIAKMMDLSETNVGTIVWRTMKKLRKEIINRYSPQL